MKRNERGYMLLTLVVAMSMIPMIVAVMTSHYQNMIGADGFIKRGMTGQQLNIVRNLAITSMKDIEGDSYFEPIKEGVGNTIPTTFTVAGSDEWGTTLRYYTWDGGAPNSVNAAYSQNFTVPPINGLLSRVVSAGPNKVFETSNLSTSPQGDDLVVDIMKGDVLSYDRGGWTDDGSIVRLNNPGDKVGIGTATPNWKLDVTGGIASSEWFNNMNSGTGLWNAANGNHFYSQSPNYWALAYGTDYGGLKLYYAGNPQGYLYYDATSFGLLNKTGAWAVRTTETTTELYNTAYAYGDVIVSGNVKPTASENPVYAP